MAKQLTVVLNLNEDVNLENLKQSIETLVAGDEEPDDLAYFSQFISSVRFPTKPLTLEEFRLTREGPYEDIRMVLGDYDEPIRVYIYDATTAICIGKDNLPYLVIANQQWTGYPLGVLEAILYSEFYLTEACI